MTTEIVMIPSNGKWLENVIERTILDDLENGGQDDVESLFFDDEDYQEMMDEEEQEGNKEDIEYLRTLQEMMDDEEEEDQEEDEDEIQYLGTTNKCCICHENLECLKLSCCRDAYYCSKCFDKWDSDSDSCAICRQKTCFLIE